MTDPYLLLTPVLALVVLALARFVACDWVFRIDELPPVPPGLSFVSSFGLGGPRTDFNGWAGMVILVGDKKLTVTQLGRIMLTASTAGHEVKLVRGAGNSGGIDVNGATVTIPPSAAITPSADNPGFAYAKLQPAVELLANTEYYVVSHEAAMGDVFFDLDTTVTTTDVAEVRSSVFIFDNADPNGGYQRLTGAGTTYGPVDFIYEEPA